MSKLQFRLAYRTDAAGKYNPTAPLEGNEDNMFIDADLSSAEHAAPLADVVIDLSEKGCLMVVADGMGGMNAGEVASEIAIKTVSEYFDIKHMADKSFRDSRSRMNYMEDVVVAADAAIKADARVNKDHEGMGSTIIMAWLCDDEICLTWCGDSRAYLYRPECGFWQMSKDHSYVQGLVDDHKITPDEAFDHPYGNIITRSLGDPEKKAKADSVKFDVYKGDIFMLCSDGLSGVLRDHKTYIDGQRIDSENLQDIIAANRATMAQCRDELFAAAERNDWYDNVTAILCEIVSGQPLPAELKAPVQAAPEPSSIPTEEPLSYTEAPNPVQSGNNLRSSSIRINKKRLPLIIALLVVVLGGAGFLTWWLTHKNSNIKAEQKLFDKCQTLSDYRTFLVLYPNGNNAEFAKAKVQELYSDSLNQAKGPKAAEVEPTTSGSGQSTTKPEKKEEKKEETKLEQIFSKEPTGNNERSIEEEFKEREKKKTVSITPSQPQSEEEIGEKKGNSNLTNANTESQNPNLTGGPQLRNVGLNQTQSAPPKSEEEAYQRASAPNATLEDCLYWLDKYGDATTRDKQKWVSVKNKFWQVYSQKLSNCKTAQECDRFINEHDNIMKRARLAGSDGDKRMRESAENKKRSLENKS